MGITKAIVVGISNYACKQDFLPYARPSAELLAKTLDTNYHFDDILEVVDKQATRDGIHSALNSLSELRDEDAALVAFCGHGKRIRDKWYFVPQDASLEETNHRKLIPDYELINEYIDGLAAGHILLIIDACYGGMMLRRSSVTNDAVDESNIHLEELMSPSKPSRYAISSGEPDDMVLDSGGAGVSIFMEEVCSFLQNYKHPVLPATRLGADVPLRVVQRLTFGATKQRPMASYIGNARISGGVFCFRRKTQKDKRNANSILTQRKKQRSTKQEIAAKHYSLRINLADWDTCELWKGEAPLMLGENDALAAIIKRLNSLSKEPTKEEKEAHRIIVELLHGRFDAYLHTSPGTEPMFREFFVEVLKNRPRGAVAFVLNKACNLLGIDEKIVGSSSTQMTSGRQGQIR